MDYRQAYIVREMQIINHQDYRMLVGEGGEQLAKGFSKPDAERLALAVTRWGDAGKPSLNLRDNPREFTQRLWGGRRYTWPIKETKY
jgi:hypothetical protein